MRKNLAFAALAAAALAAACAKESASVNEQENLVRMMTFTASSAPVTKTSLAADMGIIWSTEDRIGVYASGKSSPEPFGVASVSREGRTAEFSGSAPISSGYVAVYPYDSAFTLSESGDAVSVTVPPVQNAVLGSFDPAANVSVAQTSGTDLLFRNAGALLKITVGNDGVKSIRIAGKGSSDVLSGAVSLDLGGDVPAVKSVETGSSSVELVGDFVKGGSYYAVVCPGTFSDGMTLTLTDADGATAELVNDASLEAARNTVVDFATVDVPADRWLRSYVLNGKAEIEEFVKGKGDKKETVNNLTIKGRDVSHSVARQVMERVAVVKGTFALDGCGTDSEGDWFDTEGFLNGMELKGSIVFRNIVNIVNPSAFEHYEKVCGDLIIENCPKFVLSDWSGLKAVKEVEGNLVIKGCTSLSNGDFVKSLKRVGGDFDFENNRNIWSFKNKGEINLEYIGGDLILVDNPALWSLIGFDKLTHLGGNVVISGNNSKFPATNRNVDGEDCIGFCLLKDYSLSGVLSPDATVSIKSGDQTISFENLTSCDPNIHNSYVLDGHDAVVRFVNAGISKETVKDLTVTGSDVTRDDFSSLGRRVGAVEGTLTVDGIGSSSSDLNFDWMSGFSELGGLTIKNSYVGNPNGMQNIKKIAGDLVLESCPKFPSDWDPFTHLEEIGGSLKVRDWTTGFNSRFMPNLKTVVGDFSVNNTKGFWNFRSTALKSIGGDLSIQDCTVFGEGEALDGFNHLEHIGGNVILWNISGWMPTETVVETDDETGKVTRIRVGLCIFNWYKENGVMSAEATIRVYKDGKEVDMTAVPACNPEQ